MTKYIHDVKIIQTSPLNAELYIDDMRINGVVSYQVNASCTERQTITIIIQADVEIENKEGIV